MGEPLILGQRLLEYIDYAKSKNLEVCLNTNAVLLTQELAKAIIKSKLDKVIVSIDATSEETYNKIRVGGDFKSVYNNVASLLSTKKEMKSITPEVITQFIVMEENENELKDFKKYWLDRRATVKIRPKLGWGDAVSCAALDEVAEKTKRFPCSWLTRTVSIHYDGSFSQCDADYEGYYSPGHLKDSTIKEVWTSELANRRKRHWELDFDNEPCKNCKDWLAGRSYFFNPES